MVCFFIFCSCQETLHSLSDDDMKTGIKKKKKRTSFLPILKNTDITKTKFFSFLPILKNTDMGNIKESYLVENHLLKHPQRMMISSFKQDLYHTIFQFCFLNLGLQNTKFDRFLKYIPRKLFNSSFSLLFIQSEQLTETHCWGSRNNKIAKK